MFVKRHKNRLLAAAGLLAVFMLVSWIVPIAHTSNAAQDGQEEAAGQYALSALRAERPESPAEESVEERPAVAPEATVPTAAFVLREPGKELMAFDPLAPEEAQPELLLEQPAVAPEAPAEPADEAEKAPEAAGETPAEPAEEEAEAVQPEAAAAEPYLVYHELGYYQPGENGVLETPEGEVIHYSEVIAVSATAYTTERQTNKITATGTVAHVGGIAVDPKVIPYGTKMYIVSAAGAWAYGYATAEDCGGGIKGNKIDLFFDTYDECIEFGVRNALVYILADEEE